MRGRSTGRTENDRVAGIEYTVTDRKMGELRKRMSFFLFFISLPHENGSEARVLGYIPHTGYRGGYGRRLSTAIVSKTISTRFTIVI